MIVSFLFFCRSEDCSYYIDNEPGLTMYSFDLSNHEGVCMNIQYFPTYIIFNQYGKDSTFTKTTYFPNKEEPIVKSTFIRYLPSYDIFTNPFSSFSISAEEESKIEFYVLSVPGLCGGGVLISTKNSDTFTFSDTGEEFLQLRENEDKCIILGNHGNNRINIEMSTSSNETQLFQYESYFNFTSYYGNYSGTIETSNSFFRISTLENITNTTLTFTFENEEEEAYLPRTEYFKINDFIDKCNPESTWVSEELALSLSVIAIFMLLFTIVLITAYCKCSQNDIQIKPEQETYSLASVYSSEATSRFSILNITYT